MTEDQNVPTAEKIGDSAFFYALDRRVTRQAEGNAQRQEAALLSQRNAMAPERSDIESREAQVRGRGEDAERRRRDVEEARMTAEDLSRNLET